MTAWPQDELQKIAAADDLHISPLRDDDGPLDDRIDEAYRSKYPSSPYLAPMVSSRAQ